MPRPSGRAVEAYASEVSVGPGETVHLHVSTFPPAPYRIDMSRESAPTAAAREPMCVAGCDDVRARETQALPLPDALTGELHADWPVTDEVVLPSSAPSGYYVFRVAVLDGPSAGTTTATTVIVRQPRGRPSAILVQVPVNTWQAYNGWGGRSLYPFTSAGGLSGTHVAFDRPYDRPDTPFVWELQGARFLEQQPYSVSYQTDVDTDRDPTTLLRHQLVVTVGHGEYWTRLMRDAFDTARDTGTNLLFLGANTGYWQARYEDDRRTLVEYRSSADPIADPREKTILFRDHGWAECELLGVQYQGREGIDDYSVDSASLADRWMAATGFTADSTVQGVVGPERDAIPAILPAGCTKPGITRFFRYGGGDGSRAADAVRYVAPSGARVFSSGSLQFSWGLDGLRPDGTTGVADPRLQHFMANALDDLTRPAAPASVTATEHGGTVTVNAVIGPEMWLRSVRFTRFSSGRAPAIVCASLRTRCDDRPPAGVYRYAAAVVDRWRPSYVTLSAPVVVRTAGAVSQHR